MSNKANPNIPMILDKKRNLRFDLNAMVYFEAATGKNLLRDGGFFSENMSVTDLRAMLWSCLVHEDEGLTIEQTGALISTHNMVEITSKLNEAFSIASPDKTDGESKGPLVEKPSTG